MNIFNSTLTVNIPGQLVKLSNYMWSLKDGRKTSSSRWTIVEKLFDKIKIIFYPLGLAEKKAPYKTLK